jgi:hypothetical protein
MIVGGQRDAPIVVKRMRSPMVNTIFMANEYLEPKELLGSMLWVSGISKSSLLFLIPLGQGQF